jgi:hypothetical protein
MVNDKYDVESVKCPQCGGDNHYIYNKDELQFDYGEGWVNYDHACKDCGRHFRSYTKFIFVITDQSTSN